MADFRLQIADGLETIGREPGVLTSDLKVQEFP
jgi:hypothetical protein